MGLIAVSQRQRRQKLWREAALSDTGAADFIVKRGRDRRIIW